MKEIPKELKLPAGTYMRVDVFTIVDLHPTEGTNLVMFVDEFCFESSGCQTSVIALEQSNGGIASEYQIQRNDSDCAGVLFISFIQIIGFKNTVLEFYYQTYS